MQIIDILKASQGGAAVDNLARTFGVSPGQSAAALEALVPALTQRVERNTLSRGGLADLISMLGAGGRQTYLDDPKVLGSPAMVADGNAILEQILGSKDISRKVADRAARETGLSDSLLRQMLPVVAAMVMGGLAKGAGGALGSVVSKLGLGGEAAESLPAPGASTARPAAKGAGSVGRQSPLPLPGDDLPGIGRRSGQRSGRSPLDDLSDILRRGDGGGGLELPRGPGGEIELPGGGGGSGGRTGGGGRPITLPGDSGGSLWNLLRSILGQVLGFESKGFLGWFIKLILLRWGAGILRRILGRATTGR
ncbi:MAG: DUF937 domain-containing protein [Hyphomicrobium sp.]